MLNKSKLSKNKGYILAQGDEITAGMGVTDDVITFIVFLPRKTHSTQQESGIHALYDLRSGILGQGAFAIVKRAVERSTGDSYAVKIIDKKKVMSGMAVQREIEILKEIKHENIVRLKAFFEDDKCYYLVMDLVEGGDLMDFVTNNGPIPEDAVREISYQVLSAVEYMHSISISHRDIKPDNILIAQDEPVLVKVSDFGLAKIAKSGSHLQTFCGTLAYLAPEVLARKHDKSKSIIYSDKVDIWSIGCMIYVILTGYLPFPQNTQQALYQSITSGKFSLEPLRNLNISEEAITFLKSILQVDPSIRPSAKEALVLPWIADLNSESQVSEVMEKSSPATSFSSGDQNHGKAKFTEAANSNINENIPSTYEIPSAEGNMVPIGNENVNYSSQDLMNDYEESDKDGEDIEIAIKEQCSQPAQINSSILQSSFQNSSPIQAAPFFSVVRDLEMGSQVNDLPVGTWMIFQTIGNSIPHRDIYFTQSKMFFGRLPGFAVDIAIDDSRMSKNHCVVYQEEGDQNDSQEFCRVWLADTSTNGCYINDKQIKAGNKAMLQEGDKVYLFWDPLVKKLLGFTVHFIDQQAFSKRPTKENLILPSHQLPGNDGLSVISESSMEGETSNRRAKRALRVC